VPIGLGFLGLPAEEGRHVKIVGGNILADFADFMRFTGACEFHSGLSSALPYGLANSLTFEIEVRKLKSILTNPPSGAEQIRPS